jgi:hypothetical protein
MRLQPRRAVQSDTRAPARSALLCVFAEHSAREIVNLFALFGALARSIGSPPVPMDAQCPAGRSSSIELARSSVNPSCA